MQVEEQLDNRQGKAQIISNIRVVEQISSYLKTTLGPYGLDKLILTDNQMIVTNDGVTIIKNLKLKHPAAKLLESISIAQDEEIGDGTTSVVLLCIEILKGLVEIIKRDDGIDEICTTLEEILDFCLTELEKNSFSIDAIQEIIYKKPSLQLLARTALTSKILKNDKEYFSNLVVESLKITDDITIRKIKGGTFTDSFVFQGIAFEKCFTYAGYEQQPKKILNAKILLTNVELEWKSERENAEMKINKIQDYQEIVDAEWKIIKDKLDFAIKSGANIVLSCAPIGDYATQYFAKFGIFCAGRVREEDLNQIKDFCGGRIISSMNLNNLDENYDNYLAKTNFFEEKQMGSFRYNFIANDRASTIILRGPGDEILNEMERSIHDALMVVKKNKSEKSSLVTGGGSNEMLLAVRLKEKGMEIGTKKMFVYFKISEAFENMCSILINNFGMEFLTVSNKLKIKIKAGEKFYGVAKNKEMVADMRIEGIYEPIDIKKNIFIGAFNAAMTILKIDSTIIVPEIN